MLPIIVPVRAVLMLVVSVAPTVFVVAIPDCKTGLYKNLIKNYF